MSDSFDLGVLYSDHPALVAATPLASLWSYESSLRSCGSSDPPDHYWLHRSDPSSTLTMIRKQRWNRHNTELMLFLDIEMFRS